MVLKRIREYLAHLLLPLAMAWLLVSGSVVPMSAGVAWTDEESNRRERPEACIANQNPAPARLNYARGVPESRPILDDVGCPVSFGSPDSLAYFAGTEPGFEYDIWFDPVSCPACSLTVPYRIDSLLITLVQADGAPIDTADIAVDIRCARLAPLDFCDGPGTTRFTSAHSVILPGNSLDGSESVTQYWLTLDSAWIVSPVFFRLAYLGHSAFTPELPDPAFGLDGGVDPPIPGCSVWSNLTGSLLAWPDIWADPAPGYPLLQVAGTCDAQSPPAVEVCPTFCSVQRISAPPTLYDPQLSAVWTYFSSAQGIALPFSPAQFECSLYWHVAGTSDDSIRLTVSLGCSPFANPCCAPATDLCSSSVWVKRGSSAAAVITPVSLDLSGAGCCLPDNFWVSATVTASSPGANRPAVLFSSATAEADSVPACEQWLNYGDQFQTMPAGELGWWDVRIIGSCDSCGELLPQSCPPLDTALVCSGAMPIICSAAGVTFAAQTNAGGPSTVSRYCCAPWPENGPERVYTTTVGEGASLRVSLAQVIGGDIDVFVLSSCDNRSCVAAGDSAAVAENLAAGIYYIVIDGREGQTASFDLTVSCCASCRGDTCLPSLDFGGTAANRYYDGEFDPTDGRVHWSYYSGTGTRQHIVRLDPQSCTLLDTIGWTANDASAGRALAFDPRSGGQYWTGTVTNFALGTGRLYLVSATGNVLQNFASIPGLISLRWAGFAFDASRQHLWVCTRAATNIGADTVYCLDVTNPAVPILIRGPHRLNYVCADPVLSAGGADYVPQTNSLLIGAQGDPRDLVLCYRDPQPEYAGPPPGPALLTGDYCVPANNDLAGFGVAALEGFGPDSLGEILMTNYSAAAGFPLPHAVIRYPAHCPLRQVPCDSVQDLTCLRVGNDIHLRFTSRLAGTYTVYTTTDRNTEELPPAAPWTALTSIELPADLPAEIVHPEPFVANYRSYRILVSCP